MTSSLSQLTNSQNHSHSIPHYRHRSIMTQIANGRHVVAGAIINSQVTANCLPSVNSVQRRRRSKAARQKLFNGNFLSVVTTTSSTTTQNNKNHIVADSYLAA
ncbi:hypothetical protein [Pleurocapsa sp. PCC 7319]|uniref:hypothetical protein n=1 Tax=Pleurocapsa sp. PCC 7319 TaxID=118161 RepID=UPI0003472212|nr:hypothetical protein [Pleurocapsa sp. PCC 7319]